jgi:hypothetical protein
MGCARKEQLSEIQKPFLVTLDFETSLSSYA